jgi:hypothetical protein
MGARALDSKVPCKCPRPRMRLLYLPDENVQRLENRLAGWRMHTIYETELAHSGYGSR